MIKTKLLIIVLRKIIQSWLFRFSIRIKCVENIDFNRNSILFIDHTLDVIKLWVITPWLILEVHWITIGTEYEIWTLPDVGRVNYVRDDVSYMLYIVLSENDTGNLGTVVIVWAIWTAIYLTFLCFRCYLLLWKFIQILSLFCFIASKHITKQFVLRYIVSLMTEQNNNEVKLVELFNSYFINAVENTTGTTRLV